MALAVSCPKCRASMNVEEKFLGTRGKCSHCGEIFTMTAGGVADATSKPSRPSNPFANPFHSSSPEVETEVANESAEPRAEPFAFQFGTPPKVEPTPVAPPPAWSPFGNPPIDSASPPNSSPASYESNDEPPPPEPVFLQRHVPPPPVVLEMSPPIREPFMEQKIATVETFIVKLAAKRNLRGAHGAILREGKATTRLYVRAAGTNGDAVGWSETNPLLTLQGATVESAAAIVRRFLRQAVEGVVLADQNGWQRRLERTAPSDSGPSAIAKAAVEAALQDLLAKTLEAPLHVVWGGAKTKVVNVAYPIDGDSPKGVGDQMKRGRERGATAFQVTFAEGNESKERAAIQSTGKGLPEGCTWSVGFLKGHSRDVALRLCDAADGSGASAVRGVLAVHSPAEFARMAERTKAALVVDVEPGRAFETVSIGGIAGVVLSPNLLGWRNSRMAAIVAQSAGLRVWVAMQFEGALGIATAAHLAAGIGIDSPILDAGRSHTEAPFVEEAEGVVGPLKLTDEPGVGVAVDETLLRAAAVEVG